MRLFTGQPQCLVVDVVDSAGELAELFLRVHVDAMRGHRIGIVADLDPLDGRRQIVPGNLPGTGTQPAKGKEEGDSNHHGNEDATEQQTGHHGGVPPGGCAQGAGFFLHSRAELCRGGRHGPVVRGDAGKQRLLEFVEGGGDLVQRTAEQPCAGVDLGADGGDVRVVGAIAAGGTIDQRRLGAQRGQEVPDLGLGCGRRLTAQHRRQFHHGHPLLGQGSLRRPHVGDLVRLSGHVLIGDRIDDPGDHGRQRGADGITLRGEHVGGDGDGAGLCLAAQ
ncbi:hypothetical protein [Rhodococcus opacus]|uniref:hypothetical protein n=1 Tax=Rhodococcus opacus TaxID=37919 RepID=UPI0018E14F82|nr:hypothetical protein [Rhodococcus opacus]